MMKQEQVYIHYKKQEVLLTCRKSLVKLLARFELGAGTS
jgi:hypothetical protein